MQYQHKNQRGTIMVEIIAVLALIGVMGTSIYRQVQRRNEELDNINIASEARTIKEATLAYVQANRAKFEENCTVGSNGYGEYEFSADDLSNIEDFLPDNWTDGIMSEYKVYGTCYYLGEGATDRKGYYATIIPTADAVPANFNLRRAGRVAMLIGADGGIHESKSNTLIGTQGAWETVCPPKADCDKREDDFYVITTGLDTYIPEVEDTPDNAVAAPRSMAFERLHGTDYFSVGDRDKNCVSNYADGKFAHETLSGGVPVADEIQAAGGDDDDECDPLFWVGTWGQTGDNSTQGHVYVKKNMYIGRDNANEIHAIAIETGADNSDRQITVHDTNGNNRLTINAKGQIIGRTNSSTGTGYKLDAETGEIILFKEGEVEIGTNKGYVQAATMRLKDGMLETNEDYTYSKNGTGKREKYRVDPAYTSLMNDIRLSSRGGAKLSDILPNYIAKDMTTFTNSATITKPTCPDGYARAVVVTPISWSQYVKSAELTINQDTDSKVGTASHAHNLSLTLSANKLSNGVLTTDGATSSDSSLTLTQHKPVQIEIDSDWSIKLTYGDDAPTEGTDDITAMAQTYCVFDKGNFKNDTDAVSRTGYYQDSKDGAAGDGVEEDSDRPCTNDYDCANTEECDLTTKLCVKYGTCTEDDGKAVSGETNMYCIGGQKTFVECLNDSMCEDDETCYNNRCKENSGS